MQAEEEDEAIQPVLVVPKGIGHDHQPVRRRGLGDGKKGSKRRSQLIIAVPRRAYAIAATRLAPRAQSHVA
jgi:hypothetical protein